MKDTATPTSLFESGFGKIVLTLFMSFLIAAVLQIGISAFYPAPQEPIYPNAPTPVSIQNQPDAAYTEAQANFTAAENQYTADSTRHAQWSLVIVGILAVALMVLSLFITTAIPIFADATLLSGIFLITYTIFGVQSQVDSRYEFGIILGVLLALLLVIYSRFAKSATAHA